MIENVVDFYSTKRMQTPLSTADFSASVKTLTKSDFRTLGLATLGGALEFYDFIIFVFFLPTRSDNSFFRLKFQTGSGQSQTFGLFAVGYFVRPLSGTIMGHFGDLIGLHIQHHSNGGADAGNWPASFL